MPLQNNNNNQKSLGQLLFLFLTYPFYHPVKTLIFLLLIVTRSTQNYFKNSNSELIAQPQNWNPDSPITLTQQLSDLDQIVKKSSNPISSEKPIDSKKTATQTIDFDPHKLNDETITFLYSLLHNKEKTPFFKCKISQIHHALMQGASVLTLNMINQDLLIFTRKSNDLYCVLMQLNNAFQINFNRIGSTSIHDSLAHETIPETIIGIFVDEDIITNPKIIAELLESTDVKAKWTEIKSLDTTEESYYYLQVGATALFLSSIIKTLRWLKKKPQNPVPIVETPTETVETLPKNKKIALILPTPSAPQKSWSFLEMLNKINKQKDNQKSALSNIFMPITQYGSYFILLDGLQKLIALYSEDNSKSRYIGKLTITKNTLISAAIHLDEKIILATAADTEILLKNQIEGDKTLTPDNIAKQENSLFHINLNNISNTDLEISEILNIIKSLLKHLDNIYHTLTYKNLDEIEKDCIRMAVSGISFFIGSALQSLQPKDQSKYDTILKEFFRTKKLMTAERQSVFVAMSESIRDVYHVDDIEDTKNPASENLYNYLQYKEMCKICNGIHLFMSNVTPNFWNTNHKNDQSQSQTLQFKHKR